MRKLFQRTAIWFAAIACVSAGCSSSVPSATSDPAEARLRTISTIYRQWTELHNGAPPAQQDQFVAFVQQDPSRWSQAAETAEELLVSPRDNQPFVIVCGTTLKDSAETGFPWVAREETGLSGKGFIVDLRGRTRLLESQEAVQAIPSP